MVAEEVVVVVVVVVGCWLLIEVGVVLFRC